MNDAVDGMREMPASNADKPEPGRVSIVPRSAYSSLCRRVQLNAVYAHRFLIRHQSINACDSKPKAPVEQAYRSIDYFIRPEGRPDHRDSCVRGGLAECESIGGDISAAGNAKTPAGWAGVSGLREPDDYLLSHGNPHYHRRRVVSR
ncbi:hypothetical protein, partial [Burkholderia ubonensis]|uniref:hypothetical protein n=2 Tax=Burkholderia ubonensis TaxID=101571 RepID=UPI001E2E5B08